jgi:hypothetical protein
VPRDLLDRLRAQLKRDPSDGQVAFLLSLAVREPFIVYGSERARLRRLLSVPARSDRDVLLAEVAEQLLAKSATPSRGLRRSESIPPDVQMPGGASVAGGRADEPAPKGPHERETDPARPKRKR